MKQLEKPLDDAFKSLPQLPENARKGLAAALPWLALLGAVFAFIGAAHLYNIVTTVNYAFSGFGYLPGVAGVLATTWIGVALLLAEGVLFLVAFPDLRTFRKKGWSLLLWAMLISAFYGVVMNLFNGSVDLSQLIVSLLGAAIGLYFLFQVRPYFTTAGGTTPVSIDAKPVEKPAEKVETPVEKTDKEA